MPRTPAAEICSDTGEYFDPPGWSRLVESLGHYVLDCGHAGQYQGDSAFVLCDESGHIGFLVFGWGSCSGCDALQACTSTESVAALQDDLDRSTRWFDTIEEFAVWAESKDWALDVADFGDLACRAAAALRGATPASMVVAAGLLAEGGMSLDDATSAANRVLDHRP